VLLTVQMLLTPLLKAADLINDTAAGLGSMYVANDGKKKQKHSDNHQDNHPPVFRRRQTLIHLLFLLEKWD
jgi:hypothetical protein